ncbi:MAG: acyltransferase [Bacteroidaceae bacterium]|nr:acyltransferase [Bacteroidaceae bacterium]
MKQITYSSIYLASKPRYEILDGLRGVAALLVVAYHLLEIHYHGGPDQPINHGYLAVDFFFVLSGFVIGYAYDDRWNKMSTWAFFKRRLIRLHPMVIFGTLFGALMFCFGSCEAFPLINETPWWMVALVMLWCFTMIPLPHSMDIRGWAETNPLNGPAWSLQWEYLANVLYALLFRRFSKVTLSICVAIFAVLTITLCLDIDVTGFLQERSYASYTVVGGWSTTPDQLQVGLTRLLYPFFSGLLVSRVGKLIKVSGGFWWCSLMITILFCMPWMGLGTEGESRWTNGLYEAFCILVCFPLIVAIGAGSSVKGGKSEAINRFLGDISYPLYITHFPLIYMLMSWTDSHKDAPLATHIFASICVFILAILVAYGAYKLYDLPVREWLKKKWFKTNVQ